MKEQKPLIGYVFSIIFSALLCASSFIIIPLPFGIPITIQDMIALLNGILLGPIYGTLSVLLFLVIGSLGLPVFTCKGGIHIILNGPTGGILIGYFFATLSVGILIKLLMNKNNKNVLFQYFIFFIVALIGFIIIFTFGILGFMHNTGTNLIKSIFTIFVPFIPVTIIKLILVIFLSKKFYKIIKNYLY